jgi:two-component system KDP operon response regulator KdpE
VLIVDDEVQILRALRINLEARGLLVTTSQNGDEALRFVRDDPPDLVILDLELPGTSGREILRALRSSSDVPVLILSARSGDPEKVLALDEGANDYLAKPFSIGDLVMRVRALLQDDAEELTMISTRDFTLDFLGSLASRGGEHVTLSEVECEDALQLRHHMTRIRRKLEPEPARPRYFRTEPGIGYRYYGTGA